jgi:thiosulfate dehydrogenase (quinone) large subunit
MSETLQGRRGVAILRDPAARGAAGEVVNLRRVVALLRITLGIIILATWYSNLHKGLYTAGGITGLFNYIFNDNGGSFELYRAGVEATILQWPGAFAVFMLVAELLMGLGLLLGVLTPVAGLAATLFFFNLFLAYIGGSEWLGTYIILTASAFVVALTRSGRSFGIDSWLLKWRWAAPLATFI